jgi:PhnB protein
MSKGIPAGSHTLSPHLIVKDAAAAIEFYKKAFGAVEGCRLEMPGTNQVMHAGLQIGDSMLMLGGEFEGAECSSKSPSTLGGTPVAVHLLVENVDEVFKTAIEAGAQEIMPPSDMFWGDRYGKLKDPFGHEWSIATHIRDMSQEEIQTAAEAFFRQPQPVG